MDYLNKNPISWDYNGFMTVSNDGILIVYRSFHVCEMKMVVRPCDSWLPETKLK